MSDAAATQWSSGAWRRFRTPDRRLLILSVAIQLAVALVLGHSRDTRMFMAAGYLVGGGHSPYVPMDLTQVFSHVGFKAVSTVGYPPPWPLLLGGIYRVTYGIGHNIYVYNLAIKLPVIAANVALAYLAAAVLDNLGARSAVSRRAWLFLLFNPFVIYVGAAWGQIDAIVAVISLAALVLLYGRRWDLSAALLALAVCFKPIAAPVVLVALVYVLARSRLRALRYAAVFFAAAFVLYVLPFLLFGWSSAPVRQLNAHFLMSGSMSLMTVVRLVRDPLLMQGHWWLLGLAWIPALAVAVLMLRHGVDDFADLTKKSLALVLVFFLTRTWLAEPNVVLVLPLALVLASLGELDRRLLTALWVVPLVFTIVNASPVQLLWVAFPATMEHWLADIGRFGEATLVARAVLVVAWQIAGWWTVVVCLRRARTEPVRDRAGGSLVPWS